MDVAETVDEPYPAFADRREAGRRLASLLQAPPDPKALVAVIPRGGIPVGRELADALRAPLIGVFVRKLPIPDSPEMGFGAVALDGSIVVNEPLVSAWAIDVDETDRIAREVLREVWRRAREYGGETAAPDVEGRHVYLVDDGLATGYTMIAAAKMMRNGGPSGLTLAVPVSPVDSLRRVATEFDDVHCLIAQRRSPFAVASFYRKWKDLTDLEVREMLKTTGGC